MATTGTSADAATNLPVRTARPLILAAAGTIAIGLLTRQRELVRGGVRLGAVQLAAAAIDAAVHRLDTPATNVPAPPPMVTEAMALWLAETLVGAALDRIEGSADRVIENGASAARR